MARLPRANHRTEIADFPLEDHAIQEDKGIQRLVLRGRRYVPLHREVREKGRDPGPSHLCRVPLPMEEDEAANPLDVRLPVRML